MNSSYLLDPFVLTALAESKQSCVDVGCGARFFGPFISHRFAFALAHLPTTFLA